MVSNCDRSVVGPLCSFLCNKFSCRHVVIVGSLILTVTHIMTAYAPNLETVFVTFGVLGGTCIKHVLYICTNAEKLSQWSEII